MVILSIPVKSGDRFEHEHKCTLNIIRGTEDQSEQKTKIRRCHFHFYCIAMKSKIDRFEFDLICFAFQRDIHEYKNKIVK